MNIIILGVPGSGKGTQVERLAERFGLYSLQSGDLSREWAKKDKRIKKIVQSGELIPEKEMTEYVLKHLEQNASSREDIIFEGWPRFVTQYQDLENWLSKRGQKINAVIFLDIKKDTVVKRLSFRRICSKCGETYNLITDSPSTKGKCQCGEKLIRRKDDSPKSIKTRFEFYRNNTGKLVDFLRKKGQLIEVDGERPIEVIFEDILKRLKKAGLIGS
jgi:adenylate kinase